MHMDENLTYAMREVIQSNLSINMSDIKTKMDISLPKLTNKAKHYRKKLESLHAWKKSQTVVNQAKGKKWHSTHLHMVESLTRIIYLSASDDEFKVQECLVYTKCIGKLYKKAHKFMAFYTSFSKKALPSSHR